MSNNAHCLNFHVLVLVKGAYVTVEHTAEDEDVDGEGNHEGECQDKVSDLVVVLVEEGNGRSGHCGEEASELHERVSIVGGQVEDDVVVGADLPVEDSEREQGEQDAGYSVLDGEGEHRAD